MKHQLLLVTALALGSLGAQEPAKDPYIKTVAAPGAAPGAAAEAGPQSIISVCYETFSLPLALAAKIQRDNPTDPDLYRLLTTAAANDNVRQENFTILRCLSGQKATTESISEQIYPTEYEPPSLPDSLGVAITPPKAKEPVKPKDAAAEKEAPAPKEIQDVDASKLVNAPDAADLANLAVPGTPTAFETRNTGATLEMEATMNEDATLLGLRIVPEHVVLVGHSTHGQGLSTVEMPTFESQRINSAITVKFNQPSLLGTLSRPPGSKVDPDSANRVWFAFVTATLKP